MYCEGQYRHYTARKHTVQANKQFWGVTAGNTCRYLYGLTDEGELSATNVSREDPRFAFHFLVYKSTGGTRWRSWLRCCFVSRKVAGSIPGGNIGFILPHYALGGSTQPPNTNEQDWYILGGKAGRCVGLTTLPRGSLHLLEPSGSLKVCTGKVLPLLYKAQVPH